MHRNFFAGGAASNRSDSRFTGACSRLALALGIATAPCIVQPAVAQSATQSISIPAGPLDSALLNLATRAKISVFVPPALAAGKTAPSISGTMTPDQALGRLLQGSGLAYNRSSDGTYVIVRAQAKKIAAAFAPAAGQGVAQGASPSPSAAPEADNGEIIVTARKREESIISVPVVMSAIGSAEIQRRGLADIDVVTQLVPQLVIGSNQGSVQGGTIALRGISGPTGNPQGEQAVAFNIDGVQIAKASVRRIGLFDLERIEVLKGPQALFYGKNSPGGIITLKTADPATSFKASLSSSYEFEANEFRTEGYVSVPVSETLGVRLAGFVSRSRGYFKETTPDSAYLAPNFDWSPRNRSYGVRGTVKFDPSDRLTVRGKLAYGQFRDNGGAASLQNISCPTGTPQTGGGNDCRADGRAIVTSLGPVIGTYDPIFRDGSPYSRQRQLLMSLEIGYDLTDAINLTSITGYYSTKFINTTNYSTTYNYTSSGGQRYNDKEFSQEFRINTSYDGPINFTSGLFYGRTKQLSSINYTVMAAEPFAANIPLYANLINNGLYRVPVQLNHSLARGNGSAYSAFLQMRFNPVPEVEISAGGRYSHETKSLPLVLNAGNRLGAAIAGGAPIVLIDYNNPAQVVTPGVSKKSWNDFSPEVTVSYKPNRDLNVFASYKHGFLSGGFNTSNTPFVNGFDSTYNPETVKGFEAGIKGNFFDRRLQANFALYTYKVNGLQVTNFVNGFSKLDNAAGVRVKGAEFDFRYRTPLEGLSLRGAAAYNKGRYTSYPTAPCYAGQSAAEGCNVAQSNQDLSGTQLPTAPKWNLSTGFDFDTPIGSTLTFGLSGGVVRSSSFLTDTTSNPDGRMPAYTLIDASVRIGAQDDRWRIDVIGRNLTNKYYWLSSTNVPFTGGAFGSGQHGDVEASVNRGREVALRATVNF